MPIAGIYTTKAEATKAARALTAQSKRYKYSVKPRYIVVSSPK